MSVNRDWVEQLKPGGKVIIVNNAGDMYLATVAEQYIHATWGLTDGVVIGVVVEDDL